MIDLTCTQCKQALSIDDAFAGGVCRCQYCGAIQTVPLPGKGNRAGTAGKTLGPVPKRIAPQESAPASGIRGGQAVASGRTTAPRNAADGSGLDQLADVVTSSGLVRTASRRGPATLDDHADDTGLRAFPLPWLIGSTAGVVLLIGIVLIAVLHNANPKPVPVVPVNPNPLPNTTPDIPPPVAVGQPHFATLPLHGDTVVYLLDNGSSASDLLPAMEAACIDSVRSLGGDHRFKVMFWREHNPIYPPGDDTARATPDEAKKCETALGDAFATGSSTINAAFTAALTARPDAIVIVTPKAQQLPDDFAKTVLSLRGQSTAKVYTIGIDGDSSTDLGKPGVLASVAQQTGGQFLSLTTADLNRLSH